MIIQERSLYQVSEEWLEYTIDAFIKMLVKKKIGQSGYLQQSFVKRVIGSMDTVQQLEMAFAYYGRFRDMGVRRGVSINDVRSNLSRYRIKKTEHTLLSAKRQRKPPKMDGKWYNKTLSGRLKDLNKILNQYYQTQGVDFVGHAFKNENIIDVQL